MKTHANTVEIKKPQLRKDIYVIKNRINEKVYVGQSVDAGQRFIQHCKASSDNGRSLIARAIQKYGANNFWYEILESQVENYNEREKYWIKKLNSIKPNGYNILEGGEEPPTFYSFLHPSSCFKNEEEVDLIKNDLKFSTISLQEIADKYGVSKRTILRINQGINYNKFGEEYPIRATPNKNGKLSDEDVEEIIDILRYTYRQYADIAKQYGISVSAIKQINSGDCHPLEGIKYPIRTYKNSGKLSCTYEQVTEIIDLLLNSDLSCRQIAKIFNIDLQTIYHINNGSAKRYRREGLHYPLRER